MNLYSSVTSETISNLARLVGEGSVSTRRSDLDSYPHDQCAHEAHRPKVLIWAENVEHVSRVLAYAKSFRNMDFSIIS